MWVRSVLLLLGGLRASATSTPVSLGSSPPCRHHVPSDTEVINKVHLKANHVVKRDVDEHLRIKTVYDKSVEELLPEKKNLVKNKLFPQAISYLEKTFQVRRPAGTILLSRQCATNQYLRKENDPHRYCTGECAAHTKCGPVVVPEEHLQQCRVYRGGKWPHRAVGVPDQEGISDADFVLYVGALATERCSQENIISYAAYCQQEANMDRPIAGYANLCPNMISTQPQEFIGMLSTVKHEVIHALGFSAGLFAFYHDKDGNPLTSRFADGLPPFNYSLGLYQWSDKVVRKVERLWDIRDNKIVRHTVYLLVTPRVVEEARKHFDCPVLEGMELENQGGMGTELNHWEKRLLEYFDELSGIPAEDLPYYGGSVEIADYCPFSQEFSWHLSGEYQRSSDCRILENQPDYFKNYGAEKYGPHSVCLIQKSAFVMEKCERKLSYPDWGSGCYQVSCSPQGLKVWVQDTSYLCSRAGQVLPISIQMNGWIHDGNLLCPSCWDFCELCPPETDPPATNLTRALPLATQPPSSATQPRSSATQPRSSATQPPSSATQPPSSATQPPSSATQPRSSATQPPSSATQPPSSATQPRSSATQPRSSATQPRSSATQPRSSATQPPSSATQPRSSATQPRSSATQPPSSATQPPSSATQPRSSATQPRSSATQPRSSATQPPSSATQPPSSATQPRSSATQPRSSATQPRSSATQPRSSATQPRSSATQPPSSATQPRSSATQPRSSATQPRSSATQPRSSATQPPSSATQPLFISNPATFISNPATFISNPTTFISNPTTFISNPTTFVGNPATFVGNPATFISNPTTFISNPTTFISNPTTFISNPATFISNPAMFISNPATFISNPTTFISNPATFISNPTTFISNPTTFISNPATFISHPATFISNPATFISNPTTFISNPATFISNPATFISNPTTFISNPATFISNPATFISNPTTFISNPATFISNPATFISNPTTSSWRRRRNCKSPSLFIFQDL
ncbi:hypothetical protein H8959_008836 [Pygathrix nigripes]